MLAAIFKGILSISLSTTPIVICLMIAAPLLRKYYSPKLCYFLWMLAVIRLLFPSAFSVTPYITIPSGEAIFHLANDAEAVAKAFAEAELLQGAATDAPILAASGNFPISWISIAAMLWMTGFLALVAVQIGMYQYSRKKTARWSIPVHDEATLRLFEDCLNKLGIGKRITLYKCGILEAPLLIGVLSLRILLPDMEVNPVQMRYILQHELTHYRRRDLWYKVLIFIVCSLHWFNPFVWILAKRAEGAMELACDADVLKINGKESRKEYGMSILSFVRPAGAKCIPLTTSFSGGRKQIMQRFQGIVDIGQKRNGVPVMAVFLCTVLFCGTLIGCGTPLAAVPESGQIVADVEPPLASEPEAGSPYMGETADEMTELEQLYMENPEELQAQQAAFQQAIYELYEQFENGGAEYAGGEMLWPVPEHYYISSAYGFRFSGTDFHTGIDISGEGIYGKPVVAANDGTIKFINTKWTPGLGYGMYIIIDHGGEVSTLYAQLSEILVKEGDAVKAGQEIGKIGSTGFSTGPNLHFEVREHGRHVNPQAYLLPADTETGE